MNSYRRACFCMEELILINPMSYIYHIRYAEILLTMGGVEKGAQIRVNNCCDSTA